MKSVFYNFYYHTFRMWDQKSGTASSAASKKDYKIQSLTNN